MAKTDRKEQLFNDFFRAAQGTFEALESQFNITGVLDQVFGVGADEGQAKANLRSSRPWTTLSALYDYAVDGIDGGNDPMDIIIDGSDVVKLVTSENYWPSEEWEQIVAMGDGRFGLDEGQPIMLFKMALLANVDIRTVRNAVSAGDLVSFKQDDMIFAENASARRWLHGRRGFKPTVISDGDQHLRIDNVNSPASFGAFLVGQRKRNGLDNIGDKLVVLHPGVTPQTISQLEAGVFALPLDAVFPLADFYQVGRKEFLKCVMGVFFYEEMRTLTQESAKEEDKK